MWRLFYPLRYFSLRNKEKAWLDLWPTLVLAALLAFPYVVFSEPIFFKSNGFLDKIIPLSSALTAFYVAALVAVATFSHPDLDKVITLGSIYFIGKDEHGKTVRDPLTRRQFSCIMFGYLSYISLIISIGAAVAVTINGVPMPNFTIEKVTIPAYAVINDLIIGLFCVAISHMVVVTSLGLYYLIERIHQSDAQIITKKSDKAS